jgi:hypothetical protein
MCQEKQALLKKFSDAGNTLLIHLRLQTDAIVSRDPEFGRFDYVIKEAKLHKQESGEAYQAHVSDHACGCAFNLTLECAHKPTGNVEPINPVPEEFAALGSRYADECARGQE